MKLWAMVFAFHHRPIPTTGTEGKRTIAPAWATENMTKRASQAAWRTRTTGSATRPLAMSRYSSTERTAYFDREAASSAAASAGSLAYDPSFTTPTLEAYSSGVAGRSVAVRSEE